MLISQLTVAYPLIIIKLGKPPLKHRWSTAVFIAILFNRGFINILQTIVCYTRCLIIRNLNSTKQKKQHFEEDGK